MCRGHGQPAGVIAVRGSKNPDGPKPLFASTERRVFIVGVKAYEFD
jgi:hypothetical protein